MCLDRTLRSRDFFRKHKDKVEMDGCLIGWKIVSYHKKNFYPINHKLFPVKYNKFNTWILDENAIYSEKGKKTIMTYSNTRYKKGFHVFLNRDDTIIFCSRYELPSSEYKIIKVFVDEETICAVGEQDYYPVVVCRRIYIPTQTPYLPSGKDSKIKIGYC
jgi:hypothetical protein